MILQRKIAIVVAGPVFLLILLLILLAAIAPRLINLNRYKDLIVFRLERELDRRVELEDIRLTILTGLGIELNGLQIANQPGFLNEPFLKVKRCQLRFKLIPLFRRQIRIKRVVLDEPEILIERAQTGQYSIDDLFARKILTPKRTARKQVVVTSLMPLNRPHPPGSSPAIATFLPQRLNIRQAKVRFIDHKVHYPQTLITTLDNLNLSFKGAKGGKVIVLDLSAEPSSQEKSYIYLKGKIIPPPAKLDFKKTTLDIEIKLNNFNLAPFSPYFITKRARFISPFIPTKIYAEAQLKGSLDNVLLSQWKLVLHSPVRQLDSANEDLAELKLQGNASWNYLTDVLKIEEVSLTADQIVSVRAHGLLKGITKLPYLDITLNSPSLYPSRILALIFPLPQLTMEGKSSCTLKLSGPSNKIEIMGRMDLSENNIEYSHIFQKNSRVPFKVDFSMITGKDILDFQRLEVLLDKLNLKGTLQISQLKDPLVQADMDFTPYDLTDSATIFPSLAEYKLSGIVEGGFSLDGKAKEPRQIDIDSEIYLKGCQVTIPQLPTKIKDLEKITGFIYFTDNSLNLKNFSLKAGDSTFNFTSAKLEQFNHQPKISFDLQGHFLNLDELIFAEKVTPSSQAEKQALTEPLQPTLVPTPPKTAEKKEYPPFLYQYIVKGKIHEDKVKVQGIYLKDLSTNITLEEGKLAWSDLYAQGFDGNIRSLGSMDFNKDKPEYQVTSSLSQLKLIPLLAKFTSLNNNLSGTLSADFNLSGKGFTKEAIHQDLIGTGNFYIAHGRISNLNILGNLIKKGVIEALLRPKKDLAKETITSFPQYTDFDQLSGKWILAQAKISFENLLLENPDISLPARGILGLDQSLNLKGTGRLSPEKTNQLIGEKYRPYLTDQQGRLEIPFTVLGTIKEPLITPDLLSLSRRGLQVYKEFFKGNKGEQLKKNFGKNVEKIIEDILKAH